MLQSNYVTLSSRPAGSTQHFVEEHTKSEGVYQEHPTKLFDHLGLFILKSC